MNNFFSPETIKRVIEFHGHQCPGLAVGIRASELCLNKLGHNKDSSLVAICETDMCGVDAIQFLTGCSVGKGNLLFKDHGKMVFTFFRREDGEGFRALLNPDFLEKNRAKMNRLMEVSSNGTATDEEEKQCTAVRSEVETQYLEADLEEMFILDKPQINMPRPAQILQSLNCEICGEKLMESRSRRFSGQTLCIPCFTKVEQKI
ncbi:formylmethanofuran dehydrogenase subunit E [Maridesulfovibrio ferrireducens]|uniref:Formylmethanofuran dehydrogenase subunit E n=1 Tax=Maridesulfovibrio ferrireducens TaxID=246191 RepID=A0A1G9BWE3_9BACT|nr:FmdE family protein [Maridesulfovibrio ferrireducens]SDK43494.1 formylmethanofuran dehydrogenase subunit E [Maridesulfovibrio ferrireducens]